MSKDAGEIEALYSALFQVLDGLWFMKTEEKIGFDKALEIDLDVWKLFGAKEAQRLVKFYESNGTLKQNDDPTRVLELLLAKSLFNKTLKFRIEIKGKKDLYFWVDECKTLAGMKKVGRPDAQASTVCNEIGFAFYDSFSRAINPAFIVECVFTPFSKDKAKPGQLGVCGWHFVLKNEKS